MARVTARDRVIEACYKALVEKGLQESEAYKERLKIEIKELDAQAEYEYFIDLYDRGVKFPSNDHNLFVAYLLGLCDDFDIGVVNVYDEVFEFPDIDIDYLPMVRDYLKNDWAPKTFGADQVCNISNYTTFGIRSSLIDMARVHGEDRNEILALTTRLGLKDDEGNKLTWDKAIELHEELAHYCDEHPDVADAARRLLDRNRGMGQHAGGLIVSKVPIDDFVPIVKGKGGTHSSAWVEGLAGTDLQPVGLVKFDLLVVTDLLRIVLCCKLVKDRHNLDSVCAKPGQSDWSDTSYLNDPKALELANIGKLKGVFQFDSVGIRNLVKMGGVTSFDDLPAYSSLFRPGPLGMKMHERYVERKRGRESWKDETPDIMMSIVGETYGVLVYQEQVQKILNKVGGIPDMHTERIRKAISKKKIELFGKYKEMFVEEGQERLNWTKEQVQNLWDQIESFADYGFNKSHAYAYSYISARLLWLKAHYPIEFFTTTLACESDDKKIREYKLEAERFGIKLHRLDINQSDVNWKIVGNEIYIGFSNVKGIGKEVGHSIIEARGDQPYENLTDFLQRWGDKANVLKPVIALGQFGENTRDQWEFYEHYKNVMKKRTARNKRNSKAREKLVEEVMIMLACSPCVEPHMVTEEDTEKFLMETTLEPDESFKNLKSFIDKYWCIFEQLGISSDMEFDKNEFFKLVKKFRRNVLGFQQKVSEDTPVVIESFRPEGSLADDKIEAVLDDISSAEREFYGFSWDHPIQDSTDFDSELTFMQFEEDDRLDQSPVQCWIIKKPEKKTARNGKTTYWQMRVEDAHWNQLPVNIWKDDYSRFEQELMAWDEQNKGNFIQINLRRPPPGMKAYSISGPKRNQRAKLPPKDMDGRILVLSRSQQKADDTAIKIESLRQL